MCADIREQAESELAEAHKVLEQVRELEAGAQSNLSDAVSIKRQAQEDAVEVLKGASDQASDEMKAVRGSRANSEAEAAATLADAGELMSKARSEAEGSAKRIMSEADVSANRVWANANTEIERVKSDLEAARAAALQELGTQRTLTDMLRERVAGIGSSPESEVSDGEVPVQEAPKAKTSKPRKKASTRKAKSAARSKKAADKPVEVPVPVATATLDVEPENVDAGEIESVVAKNRSAFEELAEMIAESAEDEAVAPGVDVAFESSPMDSPEPSAEEQTSENSVEDGASPDLGSWMVTGSVDNDGEVDDAQVA